MAKKPKLQSEAEVAENAVRVSIGEADGAAPENRRVPQHPVEPSPLGSSTEPSSVPTGKQGEDIRYETDDIHPDGTPMNSKGFVRGTPEIDGMTGAKLEVPERNFEVEQAAQDEEAVASTPWGAELHELKEQRKTRFEDPAEADPRAATPLKA